MGVCFGKLFWVMKGWETKGLVRVGKFFELNTEFMSIGWIWIFFYLFVRKKMGRRYFDKNKEWNGFILKNFEYWRQRKKKL